MYFLFVILTPWCKKKEPKNHYLVLYTPVVKIITDLKKYIKTYQKK